MLTLTVRIGEVVWIDGVKRVFVHAIKGDSVRIGFDFPRNVPVHRDEVQQRIEAEAAQAAIDGHGLESASGGAQ